MRITNWVVNSAASITTTTTTTTACITSVGLSFVSPLAQFSASWPWLRKNASGRLPECSRTVFPRDGSCKPTSPATVSQLLAKRVAAGRVCKHECPSVKKKLLVWFLSSQVTLMLALLWLCHSLSGFMPFNDLPACS